MTTLNLQALDADLIDAFEEMLEEAPFEDAEIAAAFGEPHEA